jgi:RNA polymerase sigma-70 factor (ECF subfamily)
MPLADEDLMKRFAEGDGSAFAQLLEKYKGQLAEFAQQIVRDRETAEDIVQETFLRVFRARADYRPIARFSTWLYTIATNLCYDLLRKQRRRVSLESMLGHPPSIEDRFPGAGSGRPPLPAPDVQAERRELAGLVTDLLAELSPDHRQVIALRVHEGLGYAEAAARLGCSVGTAKSRMHYAIQRLRRRMEDRTGRPERGDTP